MLGFIRISVQLELPGRESQLVWTDAIQFELPTITVAQSMAQIPTAKIFEEIERRIGIEDDDDIHDT